MRHFELIQPWPALLTPNLLRPRRWLRLWRSATRKRVPPASSTRRGQPAADPNRMSARFITRVASVLPSELFRRATGSPLRRFVTRTYASSGLASPVSALGGNGPCQRGASSFPILANSDLRSWTGPATTSTECSGETYFRTAFWKVSGVTRSRRNP